MFAEPYTRPINNRRYRDKTLPITVTDIHREQLWKKTHLISFKILISRFRENTLYGGHKNLQMGTWIKKYKIIYFSSRTCIITTRTSSRKRYVHKLYVDIKNFRLTRRMILKSITYNFKFIFSSATGVAFLPNYVADMIFLENTIKINVSNNSIKFVDCREFKRLFRAS